MRSISSRSININRSKGIHYIKKKKKNKKKTEIERENQSVASQAIQLKSKS